MNARLPRPATTTLAGRVAVLFAVLVAATAARAETLVTALSDPAVKITSNFTGAEIVVFGVVERDVSTVERPEPYDIVIVVSGPREAVVTRRKDRIVGVWVNNRSVRFVGVPSFYALHATRKLTEIADPALLRRRGIGAEYLDLKAGEGADTAADVAEFREALERLKLQSGLFAERAGAVEFLSASLFRTTVPLPANVPDGDYTVEVSLFRGGALLAAQEQKLQIGKAGFEQLTYSLAHTNSVLYGLATVVMALFTGWLAGVIFRRE